MSELLITVKAMLRADEGTGPRDSTGRFYAYPDSLGFPTIGYGQLIQETQLAARLTGKPAQPMTVYGKSCRVFLDANLDPITIDETTAELWLTQRAGDAILDAQTWAGPQAWSVLNDARRAVLSCMAYQLGATRLRAFVNTCSALRKACLETGNYWPVHNGMMASKWAKQTLARVDRLADIMLCGMLP